MRSMWLINVAVVSALTGVAILISMGVPDRVLDDEPPEQERDLSEQRNVVSVVVEEGDSARDIAETLLETGVIHSERLFRTVVSLLGYDDNLAAGVYDFEPGLVLTEVVERLRNNITSPLLVTIPEGLRLEEIADRLAAANVVSRSTFLSAVQDPANWAGTLAAERPPRTSLEGYLFPSTYRFSLRASADEVVRQMLTTLDNQFDADQLQAIASGGRSVHEVLTLASIIEREAVLAGERALIGSVFDNRLSMGMPLEADPTVQYALSQLARNVATFGYWKEALTLDDLAIDSPYNTYARAGLPPTPIANPGLAAIEAASNPAETTYLFFVARGDGAHAFAVTFEEHLRNVEIYRGLGEDPAPGLDDSESEAAQ